jgi:hypothetical protein
MMVIHIQFFLVFLGAVLTYFVFNSSEKSIMTLMLMTAWVGLLVYYVYRPAKERQDAEKQQTLRIAESVDPRVDGSGQVEGTTRRAVPPVAVHTDQPQLLAVPKRGLRFLRQNEEFIGIANDIAFVQMFDKARFRDILLYMDRWQKLYVYALSGRADVVQHAENMIQMRLDTLELMYGLMVVVPLQLRHTFGIDEPHALIKHNIQLFMDSSATMLETLRNYTKIHLKYPYFPTFEPVPMDPNRSPNIVP